MKETNPKYLKDIILSFIIAGKDTTGSTLSWFVFLLCKHPHVQEKIAQEIWEATRVGDSSTIEELAAKVTDDSLEKMQYLHAALSETLRLYPAVPLVIQQKDLLKFSPEKNKRLFCCLTVEILQRIEIQYTKTYLVLQI